MHISNIFSKFQAPPPVIPQIANNQNAQGTKSVGKEPLTAPDDLIVTTSSRPKKGLSSPVFHEFFYTAHFDYILEQ
jgi:hypothetical protein